MIFCIFLLLTKRCGRWYNWRTVR